MQTNPAVGTSSGRIIWACLLYLFLVSGTMQSGVQDFYDRSHYSPSLDEWRNYRILLPRDYETSGKYYPVIYYFHGHSGRYTGEQYGNGQVFLPEMIDYVRHHDVIVVKWDGYVEEDYDDFYGGTPYDIQNKGRGKDFGAYFLDLVAHIDSTYRTLKDRQHRATCGLSMGGFMSLYVSGRFPDLVGSASAFNPAHEFFVGPEGAKVLYRHSHHLLNHGQSKVRLVKASGDYIGQYHDLLREEFARTPEVDFEFRQDEYHRHWVTSVAETFDFHMRAFQDVGLTAHPRSWSYDNAYPSFSLWGYEVRVENKKAGFVSLRDVSRGHYRILTHRYAPDGPPVGGQRIRLTTAPLYGNKRTYRILDYSHRNQSVNYYELASDEKGRLAFELDGSGHDISILQGKESRPPILLPMDRERPIVFPDQPVHLPIRLLNSTDVKVENVRVSLTSEYPTVTVEPEQVDLEAIEAGEIVDLSDRIVFRFASTDGGFQHCRLLVTLRYRGWYSTTERIDVRILPTPLPVPVEVRIMDGRSDEFAVFRQAGNQGGGFIQSRTVEEGSGNGDGRADPGEEVTLWVRTAQGLDPFDKDSWHRTWIYTQDPCVTEFIDIAEPKGREWTSVHDHMSAIRISPDCSPGHQIDLVLKNESYSFVWTPDTRYGKELLYQAIQKHRVHLARYGLVLGGRKQ